MLMELKNLDNRLMSTLTAACPSSEKQSFILTFEQMVSISEFRLHAFNFRSHPSTLSSTLLANPFNLSKCVLKYQERGISKMTWKSFVNWLYSHLFPKKATTYQEEQSWGSWQPTYVCGRNFELFINVPKLSGNDLYRHFVLEFDSIAAKVGLQSNMKSDKQMNNN